MKRWKHIIAGAIAAMLIGLLLGGCSFGNSSTATGGDAKTVRIALQPTVTWAPLVYMKEKGTLDEALKSKGIHVQWTEFQAGPALNESFAAGQQDVGVAGDVPIISALAAGQRYKIIGQGGRSDRSVAIIAGKDSGITSPAQLKGKKIGLTVGSSGHGLVYSVLQKQGLTLQDVSLVNITPGDAEAALTSKEVDAVAFWEPNITFLLDKHEGTLLADLQGIPNGGGPIFATDAYAKGHPEVVQTILEEYAKAGQYIKAHPEEVAPVLAPHLNCTPEQVVKILQEYEYPVTITQKDVDGLQYTAHFLQQIGVISSGIDIKQYIEAGK